VAGTQSDKTSEGGSKTQLDVGESIYGPFEAGLSSRQDFVLEGLGCPEDKYSGAYVPGGIDTLTAEHMVAHACGITLPRWDGDIFVSFLDQCGGHAFYHFHERLSCLYKEEGSHSTRVGELQCEEGDACPPPEQRFLYGQWEDFENGVLPELDACGGHFGITPDSGGKIVYHYHMQYHPPFAFGCIGPTMDNKLVPLAACRAAYEGCSDPDNLITVTTDQGEIPYRLWCPCYDANASSVNDVELPAVVKLR
jgi:hypothetical protein